jgi:hypothetical protein
MLADNQTITVAGNAKLMPLVLTEAFHSFRQMSDQTFSLDIRHRRVKRNGKARVVSTCGFNQKKIVSNPLDSTNDYDNLLESLMIDRPEIGFSVTEVKDQWTGFSTWLSASSNAIVAQLYNMES